MTGTLFTAIAWLGGLVCVTAGAVELADGWGWLAAAPLWWVTAAAVANYRVEVVRDEGAHTPTR